MQKDSVLIVAQPDDVHSVAVAASLQRDYGVNVIVWETANLPARHATSFHISEESSNFKIHMDVGVLEFCQLRSIWWRRPTKFSIERTMTHEATRHYCRRECDTFFRGVLSATGIPLVNDPYLQAQASNKPYQLEVARQVGLSIPKTLMTTDPKEAKEFWAYLNGSVVSKPFRSPDWDVEETKKMVLDDLPKLKALRHAPIILQECIENGRDIRVNIFGRKVFAAEAISNYLDHRVDPDVYWIRHSLPGSVQRRLLKLMTRLSLHYGCIDLRIAPDEKYFFLEIILPGSFSLYSSNVISLWSKQWQRYWQTLLFYQKGMSLTKQ